MFPYTYLNMLHTLYTSSIQTHNAAKFLPEHFEKGRRFVPIDIIIVFYNNAL
jgi:hypothetical protein